MSDRPCPECGAAYDTDADSCEGRFDALLALDHSRREPWGSRHGQAFATFALQHPSRYPGSLDASWDALIRLCCLHQSLAHVAAVLRGRAHDVETGNIPRRPDRAASLPTVTIADLGDFDADMYAARLDAWSRATLASWGVPSAEPPR